MVSFVLVVCLLLQQGESPSVEWGPASLWAPSALSLSLSLFIVLGTLGH